MSTASKVTLAVSAAVSTAIIAYVHLSQQWDLQNIRAGVDLDIQRQNYRKMVRESSATEETPTDAPGAIFAEPSNK
ncbi:hypothetical protein BV898_11694 [Hypsibius exemplaris]|uniref:Uncharacterized protein n=1 Tax=Hypsibius exemplaris TaxID=2072580 RepID=A0A1W0WG01_HYPEX|nr:hypothetical protein BV898_11694 [Hypsibius exemplaris]